MAHVTQEALRDMYWASRSEHARLTYQYVASVRASEHTSKKTNALFLFASALGRDALVSFCYAMSTDPDALVIKRIKRIAKGFWIIAFETHAMAEAILRQGHGRLPIPGKRYPYFDPELYTQEGDAADWRRIDISWARRKHKRARRQ